MRKYPIDALLSLFRRVYSDGLSRKYVAASIWSIVFQIVSKASLLVATVVAARSLSVAQFGLLVAGQGVAVVASAVLDGGTSTLVGRDLAARRLSVGLLRGATRVRVFGVVPGSIAMSILFIRVDAFGNGVEAAWLTIAAGAMNLSAFSIALLQGALRFAGSALAQSIGRIIYVVCSLLVVEMFPGRPAAFAASFTIGELTIFAISAFLCFAKDRQLEFSRGQDKWMRRSASYWLNSIFNLTYNRADTALVAALAGSAAAGLYAPASALQNVLLVIPGIATAALPTVGAAMFADGRGRQRLAAALKQIMIVTVSLGVLAATLASVFVHQLISVSTGSSYASSYVPAVILAWSTPFYAVQIAIIGALIAMGKGQSTTFIFLTALVAALVANLLLTPRFGATGGAIGSLLREPPTLIVAWLLLRHAARQEESQLRLKNGQDHYSDGRMTQ